VHSLQLPKEQDETGPATAMGNDWGMTFYFRTFTFNRSMANDLASPQRMPNGVAGREGKR